MKTLRSQRTKQRMKSLLLNLLKKKRKMSLNRKPHPKKRSKRLLHLMKSQRVLIMKKKSSKQIRMRKWKLNNHQLMLSLLLMKLNRLRIKLKMR